MFLKLFLFSSWLFHSLLDKEIVLSLSIEGSAKIVNAKVNANVDVNVNGLKTIYLLLPEARMWCWVLMIMEQSTAQSTLWASKPSGTATCCGEEWESREPSPRRPEEGRER